MKEPIINNIFPTPVYLTKIDREYTKEELNFVKEQKKHCKKNAGNIYTKDSYILNRKEFKNIKKFLIKHCKNYLNTVICPKNNLELYITQSWLNYTGEKQIHYPHFHPNSIISGVYYINADPKLDYIRFKKNVYDQIKIYPSEFNLYNADTWWLPAETNKVILFPSSLMHEVGNVEKTYGKRVSLAFNVFAKGDFGSKETLTELKI